MSGTITKQGLLLEPLDVLFFRDGRPFGATSRVVSGHPLPQTLAGAVWTALLQKYGCDFARLTAYARQQGQSNGMTTIRQAIEAAGAPSWITSVQVRGPWLASNNKTPLEIYLPMPAVIYKSKNAQDDTHYHCLVPQGNDLPGWESPEGLRPLWLARREPAEPAEGFITLAGLKTFLKEQTVTAHQIKKTKELLAHDFRTGIVIRPDCLTTEEGGIYGIGMLALAPGMSYYIEVLLPAEAPADALAGINTLSFGGEARRVRIEKTDKVTWPEIRPEDAKQKPLLVLTTPGLFAAGWKPRCLEKHIVAAAVPGAVAVSGWDLARGGPKPTRFAAAAGSVYFLDALPDDLPEALSDEETDRRQGWGCYVKGVWSDE
jgi:CRISPR-associated protein Cmr3